MANYKLTHTGPEVDAAVTASLSGYTPSGTYANLASLAAAIPAGDNNVYLTTDNGYWNYWNGVAWTAGASYSGAGASVAIGTTATGEAGTDASVTNSGTDKDAVFNFTIPRGATGAQGPQGVQGPKGDTGPQGARGETGAKGDRGDQGIQGVKGDTGAQGIQGPAGTSFTVKALYATLAALQAAHPTGNAGDVYAVGTSASNTVYIWDVDLSQWKDIGNIQGPQGIQGERGPQGERGIQGVKGDTGATGDRGDTGPAGKTAYESAQTGGYAGTESEFNAALANIGKGGGLLPKITVAAPTGSTVTCRRGSTTLTATEINGTWTFDVPDYGTWTITATLGAKTAEDVVVVSSVQLYDAALTYIDDVDDVFANNTWQAIRDAVDSGKVPASWNVGDSKTIVLNGTMGTVTLNNFQCSLQIVAKPGFNSSKEGGNILHLRFASADGSKGLAFCDSGYGTNTSNASKFNMNPTNTNTGGFWASTMNTDILGNTGTPAAPTANSLMSCLPQEVLDVMVQCTKYNDNTGGGTDTASYVTAKQYWIALPAEFEVFGARTYANSAEQNYQQQYPFFATGNSKIHYRHDALTAAATAWERSVYAAGASGFGRVVSDGTANTGCAYNSYGVPPLLFI